MMHWAKWDVAQYKSRIGQIRVVDASSANWGHINFDDLRFDWDVVPERTPDAGAAYVFRRKIATSNEPCTGTPTFWPHAHECQWELQAKLQASDKRAFDLFGASVDIDDASGLAVVGAKHQVALDQYKETVGGDRNSGEKELERVGAVYVYSRANEFRDGVGTLIRPPSWASYEVARLQAVDYDARDLFGTAVAISNYVLFAGATGDDGKGINGGATYQSDIEFSKVAFRQKVFPYMENDVNKRAEVSVLRTGPTTDVLVVSYSTSDITAVGVDAQKFAACSLIPISDRHDRCGDYQQTFGDLTFDVGISAKSFFIPIMDNGCYEHPMEYIRVSLSVPGSGAILGENFVAKVRIDDDDKIAEPCIDR